MKHTWQNKLELFADNAQIINKEFAWQGTMSKRLAALLYAQEGKAIDCEAIRRCHDLIKQNTGVFSSFRGDMALCVAALLSLSPDSREVFSETLKVYDLLKGEKFRTSDFLAIAAYQIAAQADTSDYAKVVKRTRSFYDGMKARHFFYTGQDDYIFAAMLGLSDLNVAAGTEHMELLYNRLKDEFWDKNSVQALAQVLVLGGSSDSVAKRVLALRDALRAQKIKLDKTYTLPILGILALSPMDMATIVRDIDAAQSVLRAQKGFGALSVTMQEILVYVSSILASDYVGSVEESLLTATLSTSIVNIIIAHQAAMVAVIASASTVSTSS